MKSLLFLNSVNYEYEYFILPYIYFANKFNKNSSYEFILNYDPSNEFLLNIEKFKKMFNIEIKFNICKKYNFPIQFLRYLLEPSIKTEYTYIGDVDILIIENISNFHISQMEIFNTIFDNQIRLNTDDKRLSGLHFVKSEEYFKKTDYIRNLLLNDQNSKNFGDEELLFKICDDSKLKFLPLCESLEEFSKMRPVHGIHLSQNRKPFKNNSMLEVTLGEFKNKFMEIFSSKEYFEISQLFDKKFHEKLHLLV